MKWETADEELQRGVVFLYMARIQMTVFHVKESLSFIPYKFGARIFITTV